MNPNGRPRVIQRTHSGCVICGNKIEHRITEKRKICSMACMRQLKRIQRKNRPSDVLGKHWKVKDTTKYRGRKLSEYTKRKIGETRTAEKHWNWRGGTSRAYKDGYYSVEYKRWRMSVFMRDSFTCQNCRKVGGHLTAHHIKSFRFYPELRFVIDNGITLCDGCHRLTDNYGGNKHRNLTKAELDLALKELC